MKKHVVVSYIVQTNKLGTEWDGYKFIMLSDYHNNSYGVDTDKVIADIKTCNPDAILIAGDIYTGEAGLDNKNAEYLMEKLSKQYEIYFGLGNHEHRLNVYQEKYGKMYEQFEKHMEKCGVHVLINDSIKLSKGNSAINITGLCIAHSHYRKFKHVPMESGYMEKMLGKSNEEYFQILLAHNPVYFKEYAEWGADLILSGHLHGGMAKIPGFGGVIAPNYRLFPKYDSGMYEEYGSTMILGAGIGTHTINLRPFNPAEIVEITIRSCK